MEIVSWMAAALTLKAAEPARPMVIPADIELAWSSFLRALTTYNQGVIEANAAISALKGSDDFIGQSSASAETIHLKWEALKKRDDAHFGPLRSAEHTSELQSLMRTSYAVFCLKTKSRHRTSASSFSKTISSYNREESTTD